MKDFLMNILIDPITNEELVYDKERNALHTKNNQSIYTIQDDVPLMLPKQAINVSSQLHKNLHSDFNYADHYEKDAIVYDYFKEEEIGATKKEIQRLHEAIISIVPKDAQLILDAGCGNGWLSAYFLTKNKKVISMDISTTNPIKALQNHPSENHAALVADVFHLPLKTNSVDCIVASEIIEHVHNPKLFVTKLLAKLKPGGKLIITTPYNEKIEYYLCVHCNLPTPKNAHLHSFNKENIKPIFDDTNTSWKAKPFANKYLIKSRLNVVFGFLPFSIWKIFDAAVNTIFNASTRFIIEIEKNNPGK